METFYQNLHLLCVPSHREPVGMVHLEAMCHGVPVIASNVPGMNEILLHQENCMLLLPQMPGEIADCIEEIMDNQLLRGKLTAAGHQTARTFDYRYFENTLNEQYRKIHV
jgi:L-malate glycosyltransferase